MLMLKQIILTSCHKSAATVGIYPGEEHRRPRIHPAWRGLKREVLLNLENLHLNLQSQSVVLKQQHFHHSGTLLKLQILNLELWGGSQ